MKEKKNIIVGWFVKDQQFVEGVRGHFLSTILSPQDNFIFYILSPLISKNFMGV